MAAASSSWVGWVAVAVLLFWSVGAYNRLVRLRADVNNAFALLAVPLARQLELVRQCLPQPGDAEQEPGGPFWAGLEGAAGQFAASLAAARGKPLLPEGIAALGAAQEVLEMAWERTQREDAHDLAGPRLPPEITEEHMLLARQAQQATAQFNEAVARYNEGIAQFPASVLAWLFGFHSGGSLRAR